jgi:homoserine acetyltransferase
MTDNVRVQQRLLARYCVERVRLVYGFSMGAAGLSQGCAVPRPGRAHLRDLRLGQDFAA